MPTTNAICAILLIPSLRVRAQGAHPTVRARKIGEAVPGSRTVFATERENGLDLTGRLGRHPTAQLESTQNPIRKRVASESEPGEGLHAESPGTMAAMTP